MVDQPKIGLRVRARATGQEWTFPPGRTVSLRRDPNADVPLTHPKVSRAAHAEVQWTNDGWMLTDVAPRPGVFVSNTYQRFFVISGPVVARLGDANEGEEFEFSPIGAPVAPPAAGPVPPPAASPPPVFPPAAGAPVPPAPPAQPGVTRIAQLPGFSPGGQVGTGDWRLRVSLDGATSAFQHGAGTGVGIGRDPSNQVVATNDSVSRYHAQLVPIPGGWRYTDVSRGGSWMAGKRVMAPLVIDRDVALRLGDPLTGADLRLEVAIPQQVTTARGRRRTMRKVLIAAGVVIVLAGAAVGGVLASQGSSSTPSPTSQIATKTLNMVERSTVKLDIDIQDGQVTSWGSGSIISPDGLILTNAHVAAPLARGQMTQYNGGTDAVIEKSPPYLTVEVRGTGSSGNVQAMYRAKTIISDGYLDLAIVKIYADAHGNSIDPSTLNLPYLTIGDSDKLATADDMTIVGFPGVSNSAAATVTEGNVTAFSEDPILKSDRAWIETSARVAHGNSGGAAVDSRGRLIGVPTRLVDGEGGDTSYRVRPIAWALPLIAKAKAGGDPSYATPYVASPGGASLEFLGIASNADAACSSQHGDVSLADGATTGYIGVQVTGLAKNLQVFVQIFDSTGTDETDPAVITSDGPDVACYEVPIVLQDSTNDIYASFDPPGDDDIKLTVTVGS